MTRLLLEYGRVYPTGPLPHYPECHPIVSASRDESAASSCLYPEGVVSHSRGFDAQRRTPGHPRPGETVEPQRGSITRLAARRVIEPRWGSAFHGTRLLTGVRWATPGCEILPLRGNARIARRPAV